MQIRLSKTLHRHIELGSLEAKRSGNPQLITDIAFLSIIKEGMSHAGHILRKLLKDWEIYQLRIRIEREAAKSAPAKTQDGNIISPDEALSSVMAGVATMCVGAKAIQSKNIPTTLPVANTGHFLLWIIANKEYISSSALELYGVHTGKEKECLSQLPS